MRKFKKPILAAGVGVSMLAAGAIQPAMAEVGFGKPGEAIDLVVGYQPYYTESWSGVVINGQQSWKKYLPAGSDVKFEIGLQGSVIVGKMLGEKNHLGYMGDMPAIVSTTKQDKVDIRMIAVLGTSRQQCNVFLVKNDAPEFANGMEAVKWMDGKLVAAPHGACTDRFARWAFEQAGVTPAKYLNMNIEVITSSFKNNKLDAAVIWEPTASKIQLSGLARRAASGESFDGVEGGDAGFLAMLYEIIRDRPDVHRGWLEAELDAQLFMKDLSNATAISQMADDQTEGMDRRVLWASLYGQNPASIGGGEEKLTLRFVFDDTAKQLVSAATKFLHGRKVVPSATLRPEAMMDAVAQEVLDSRGLSAPIGFVGEQPDSAYQ
ncbi:nitrate ABC transporter substrate-binding protein [Arenicellales bacterium IMCC56312]